MVHDADQLGQPDSRGTAVYDCLLLSAAVALHEVLDLFEGKRFKSAGFLGLLGVIGEIVLGDRN